MAMKKLFIIAVFFIVLGVGELIYHYHGGDEITYVAIKKLCFFGGWGCLILGFVIWFLLTVSLMAGKVDQFENLNEDIVDARVGLSSIHVLEKTQKFLEEGGEIFKNYDTLVKLSKLLLEALKKVDPDEAERILKKVL